MSKNVSKEEIKEVVETSKEVVDTAVEAAEQTVEAVTEVTPIVVEEKKGLIETGVEIAAHARPILKKIVIGGILVTLAVIGFKAVSKSSEEEVVATDDQSYDENVLEGEFTTNEE
jgi:hypothetical protein|nr:MAG TPA: hypothetical protein [Caudoviricetes sp.]